MAKDKEKNRFSELSNVEKAHEELIPEEYPDGPYGSSIRKDEPVRSKSTPWRKGQQRTSAYVYPDQERHDDLPRQMPGSHPIHDE